MRWTFTEGELNREDVRQLLAFHFAEMRAGSPADACHVLPVDALGHSSIRLYSLRDEGRLVGVGALKTLGDAHGEVKSMRVAPYAIGRGAGSALLAHIIAAAKAMGMTRLSLETGSGPQFEAANRLYERAAFDRCGPFGGYSDTPFTRFYTREIQVPPLHRLASPPTPC